MESKEKAQEIYDRMKGFRITNKHRKKCALVCVDEMIKELEALYIIIQGDNVRCKHTDKLLAYYLEVKEELEKL